jgi:hypothetical protein
MKDDIVEKVARAMCIEQKGDPDSHLVDWRTNEDGLVCAYLPINPRLLWEEYESFARAAIRVVLEEAAKAKPIGFRHKMVVGLNEEIFFNTNAKNPFGRPAQDYGLEAVYECEPLISAASIRALGEK